MSSPRTTPAREEPDPRVLDDNLQALLTRAYRPARPRPQFEAEVRERLLALQASSCAATRPVAHRTRVGDQPWTRWLLAAASIAAVIAAVEALRGSGVGDPPRVAVPTPGASTDATVADFQGPRAAPERREATHEPSDGGEKADVAAAPRVDLVVVDSRTGDPVRAFTLWHRVEEQTYGPRPARPVEGTGGALAIAELPAASYALVVEAPGHAAWRADHVALADGQELALVARLGVGRPIEGSVHDAESGAPVSGALVVAENDCPHQALPFDPAGIPRLPRASGVTDANGAWRIEHVSPGVHQLRVQHAEHAARWITGVEVAPPTDAETQSPGGVRPIVLPPVGLESGGAIDGRILDADGAPVADKEVIASAVPMDRPLPVYAYGVGRTGPDGTFAIEHLAGGSYLVIVERDGRPAMREVTVRPPGRANVEFLAAAGGTRVWGLVVDASGRVAPSCQVALVPESEADESFDHWIVTMTDDEGAFAFTAVPPGTYGVYASPQARSMVRRDQLVVGALARDLTLTLRLTGATLSGVLRAEEGGAVEGAVLIALRSTDGGWAFQAKGDSLHDGRFVFEGLPAGRYRLSVVGMRTSEGSFVAEDIELADGESRTVELSTRPGAPLTVDVRDRAGRPVAGAAVLLFDELGRELAYSPDPTTDARGRRGIASLAPGSWRVEVRGEGHGSASTTVVIEAGLPASTTLEVDR